jgi:adenine-specific DNA-methyltransferase
MSRILTIASDADDLVLDPFAGSGTTAAVAHKLRRRWYTVEIDSTTVDRFAEPRLRSVVDGTDTAGITAAAGWAGGGGFVVVRDSSADAIDASYESASA